MKGEGYEHAGMVSGRVSGGQVSVRVVGGIR
jgi:hypothetical protein